MHALISVNQTPSEAHGHGQTLLVPCAHAGHKPWNVCKFALKRFWLPIFPSLVSGDLSCSALLQICPLLPSLDFFFIFSRRPSELTLIKPYIFEVSLILVCPFMLHRVLHFNLLVGQIAYIWIIILKYPPRTARTTHSSSKLELPVQCCLFAIQRLLSRQF